MGGSQLTQGEPHIAYIWDNLHLKFLYMYWNCEAHWCQARSLWMLKCWIKFSPRSFSLNENMTQTCNPVLCLCCATGSSKSFPLEWTTWLYPFFALMDNVARTCNLMVVSVSTLQETYLCPCLYRYACNALCMGEPLILWLSLSETPYPFLYQIGNSITNVLVMMFLFK